MKTLQKIQRVRFIILILTLSIVNFSCNSYFKVNSSANPSTEKIEDLNQSEKTFIIHFNEKKWLLTNVQVNDSIISGLTTNYRMPPTFKPVRSGKKNRYTNGVFKNHARRQGYLLNEVHLYPDHFNNEKSSVFIPINSINRIDIYDKDKNRTSSSWAIGILGISSLGYIILMAIAISSLDLGI